MVNLSRERRNRILIASITPYFLEKGNFWFEENLNKILEAKKTQNFFEDNLIFLKQRESCHLSEFLRKLDEMGYEKVLDVSYPGEFSQRGGIVDVFPINLNSAVRLDFLGNRIEEISELPVKIADEKTAKELLKKRLKSQKLFSDFLWIYLYQNPLPLLLDRISLPRLLLTQLLIQS